MLMLFFFLLRYNHEHIYNYLLLKKNIYPFVKRKNITGSSKNYIEIKTDYFA
jgi:hypothetical protein